MIDLFFIKWHVSELSEIAFSELQPFYNKEECKKDECLTNEICDLSNLVWMTPIRFQNK